MNVIKKIVAVALIGMMAMTAAACHPKDETAVTVDGVKFTSAYYMCALVYADSDARSKVQESLSEDESTSDIDYYSKKVEDTDYVKWVKNTALESLKKIAAYKIKCDENKLTIDEDTENNAKQYASYYWASYGYSQMFEPNGVGEATYTQYMLDSYYSNLYFDFLYGEGGEKEISAADVAAKRAENFVLVDQLSATYTDGEDEANAETKAKFEAYTSALQAGTMTFEQAYRDYNNVTEDTEETASEDTDEVKPLDKYATILGSADTAYASDNYDTAVAMAKDEVKMVESEDGTSVVLLIKRDLEADPYYVDNIDSAVRHLIKDEEYTADMEKYADGLKCETVSYAIKQFNVKKIVYPETSAS